MVIASILIIEMFDTRMILLEEIISRSLTRVNGLKFDGWPKMFSILTVSEKLTFFFSFLPYFPVTGPFVLEPVWDFTWATLTFTFFSFYMLLFLQPLGMVSCEL